MAFLYAPPISMISDREQGHDGIRWRRNARGSSGVRNGLSPEVTANTRLALIYKTLEPGNIVTPFLVCLLNTFQRYVLNITIIFHIFIKRFFS